MTLKSCDHFLQIDWKNEINPWVAVQLFVGLLGLALYSWYRLPAGFWLDETITALVIKNDFLKIFTTNLNYQGWSPLYFFVIHGWINLFGLNEIALRSFSLCAFVVCCIFLYLTLRRKFPPEIAIFGTIFGAANLIFYVTGLEARPYSLASAFSVGSYYFFFLWLDGKGRNARVMNIACIVATIYTHWLYGTLLLVQTTMIFLLKLPNRRSYIRQWLMHLCIIAVLCSPNIYQFALIFKERFALDWVSPPSFLNWLKYTFPLPAILCLLIICYLFLKRRFSLVKNYFNELTAGIIWLVLPTTFLYICSLFLSVSVLHFRYGGAHVAALALIIAALISCLPKTALRSLIMYTISLIIIVVFMIIPIKLNTHYFTQSWKEPTAFLSEVQQKHKRRVLLSSGLIESRSRKLLEDPNRLEYFSAPVQYYLPDQRVLPIPDAHHLSFLDDVLRKSSKEDTLHENGFYLCIHDTKKSFETFKKYFVERGFYPTIEREFNNIYVLEFQYQSISGKH